MDDKNLERKVELARITYSSALIESGTRCIAANDAHLYIGSGAKIITLTKEGKQLSAKIHPAMEIEHIAADNKTVCSVMNHYFDRKGRISITDAEGNHIHEKEYQGDLCNVALDGTRICFVLQEETHSSIIVIDRNGRDIAKRDLEGTAGYIAIDDKHIYTALNTEEKGVLLILDKEGDEVARKEHELPIGPINADSQKVFYALVDIKEIARKELESGITAPPEESLMRRFLRKKERGSLVILNRENYDIQKVDYAQRIIYAIAAEEGLICHSLSEIPKLEGELKEMDFGRGKEYLFGVTHTPAYQKHLLLLDKNGNELAREECEWEITGLAITKGRIYASFDSGSSKGGRMDVFEIKENRI